MANLFVEETYSPTEDSHKLLIIGNRIQKKKQLFPYSVALPELGYLAKWRLATKS